MLSVTDLHVNYDRAEILHGVSLEVGEKPLSVVGRNGMGKTTFCYAIMGMIPVRSGSIALDNEPLDRKSAMQVARRGIAIVPQGRRVFPSLSVDEHLKLASVNRKAAWTPERIYDTFPRLAERRSNGGAQFSSEVKSGSRQENASPRVQRHSPCSAVEAGLLLWVRDLEHDPESRFSLFGIML